MAQEPSDVSPEVMRGRSDSVLLERNRRAMHPSDPLTIVGAEQRGHDIRSPTPALARSDRRAAKLDPEELHRRTIEVYEHGTSFVEPTAPLSKVIVLEEGSAEEQKKRDEEAGRPDRKGIFGWVLGAAAIAWISVRVGGFIFRRILARIPVPVPSGPIRVAGRAPKWRALSPAEIADVRPALTGLSVQHSRRLRDAVDGATPKRVPERQVSRGRAAPR